MWRTIATCKICGWHGWIIRHDPKRCARYLKIRDLYLAGKTCREVGREMRTSSSLVVYVLKAARIKTRPRGGVNNPGGTNGRSRLVPLRRPKAKNG